MILPDLPFDNREGMVPYQRLSRLVRPLGFAGAGDGATAAEAA
jgi:hypothetical protein